MRNLIASGNLMSVEGDDEDEFWENEFRKTIIRQEPSSAAGGGGFGGVAPPPRAGCRRPVGLFNRRKLKRKLQVYKRQRRFSPFPSGMFKKRKGGRKGARDKMRKPALNAKRAEPKLAQRITNMIDPPKYPTWIGEIWFYLSMIIATLCIAVSPAMRMKTTSEAS